MTTAAYSARIDQRRRPAVPHAASLARALAVAAAISVLLLAGLALAAQLSTPAVPPIQSQEPAVTSPSAP